MRDCSEQLTVGSENELKCEAIMSTKKNRQSPVKRNLQLRLDNYRISDSMKQKRN